MLLTGQIPILFEYPIFNNPGRAETGAMVVSAVSTIGSAVNAASNFSLQDIANRDLRINLRISQILAVFAVLIFVAGFAIFLLADSPSFSVTFPSTLISALLGTTSMLIDLRIKGSRRFALATYLSVQEVADRTNKQAVMSNALDKITDEELRNQSLAQVAKTLADSLAEPLPIEALGGLNAEPPSTETSQIKEMREID